MYISGCLFLLLKVMRRKLANNGRSICLRCFRSSSFYSCHSLYAGNCHHPSTSVTQCTNFKYPTDFRTILKRTLRRLRLNCAYTSSYRCKLGWLDSRNYSVRHSTRNSPHVLQMRNVLCRTERTRAHLRRAKKKKRNTGTSGLPRRSMSH